MESLFNLVYWPYIEIVIWIIIIVVIRAVNLDLWFERSRGNTRKPDYELTRYIIIICIVRAITFALG